MWLWKDFENLSVFGEVMCRLRRVSGFLFWPTLYVLYNQWGMVCWAQVAEDDEAIGWDYIWVLWITVDQPVHRGQLLWNPQCNSLISSAHQSSQKISLHSVHTYRVARIKRRHFTFLLVTNQCIYKIVLFFGTHKLHKAATEMVSTSWLYVNSCSPCSGRYKSEYFLCIIAVLLTLIFYIKTMYMYILTIKILR